jgi:hypothetical protein
MNETFDATIETYDAGYCNDFIGLITAKLPLNISAIWLRIYPVHPNTFIFAMLSPFDILSLEWCSFIKAPCHSMASTFFQE